MNTLLAIAVIIVLWAVGFFALPGVRLIDTCTARDSGNLTARLAVHWQKTVEINYPSLSLLHKKKLEN